MKKDFYVLFVEDNTAHAKLVMREFKEHDIDNIVCHVKDGAEALDYLYRRGQYEDPKSSPRPNVILLDLRLPKVDGIEVLKQIKNDDALKEIPVVILTTSEEDSDIRQAYENNANAYLAKPVEFEKFKKQMSDLGFFWLQWNKLPELCRADIIRGKGNG